MQKITSIVEFFCWFKFQKRLQQMNGQTDEQTDRLMDGQTNGQRDEQADSQMDGHVSRQQFLQSFKITRFNFQTWKVFAATAVRVHPGFKPIKRSSSSLLTPPPPANKLERLSLARLQSHGKTRTSN